MKKQSMKKTYGIAGYMKDGSACARDMDAPASRNLLRIKDAVEALIQSGVERFTVAMDDGAGLLAASVILMLRRQYPQIHLTCLMLWEEQAAGWPESLRTLWFRVFAECQEEVILECHRSGDNRQKRDQYLTEHCQGLLIFRGEDQAEAAWPLIAKGKLAGLDIREEALTY